MLRLNVAVPPASSPNPLGIVGGDLAGFPNGRRVTDDVTNVELKALAGATIPLVSKGYKPDAAVAAVEQGITPLPTRTQATFPYVTTPHGGFEFPSNTGVERRAEMHSEGHSHDHRHDHGHSYDHSNGEEAFAARRHPEQVILDIGGNLGALIIHTDAGMVGVEVEISATGRDDERSPKDVLEREIQGRPAYTAVFDKVPAGSYTLWVNDIAREHDVVVSAAAVAELHWSDRA